MVCLSLQTKLTVKARKDKNICLVYNLNVIKGHYGPCFSISTSLSSLAVVSATKDAAVGMVASALASTEV